MNRNGVLRRVVCVMALAAMGLGGCSGKKAQFSAVMSENNELRQRNSDLTTALQEANTRNASLEQENRDMASNLDRRGGGGGGRAGDTGFEGISGVNASRGAGGEVVLEIAGEVLFDSGSVSLKSSAKSSLSKVANVIQSRYPSNMIRVEGYTDSDPIRKSNWKTNERLSAERALAVENYLVTKGLSNDQLYSAAFGPARPKPSKKDSRRVEIVILAAAG
ncbi:MAG: OmpA family protein [Phycisphaerales bacterium]|nr:OmpA family protein [Phycisphaerales bacterium]